MDLNKAGQLKDSFLESVRGRVMSRVHAWHPPSASQVAYQTNVNSLIAALRQMPDYAGYTNWKLRRAANKMINDELDDLLGGGHEHADNQHALHSLISRLKKDGADITEVMYQTPSARAERIVAL